MSCSQLPFLTNVPMPIRRAFATADEPQTAHQALEREVAARAVLDALGITGESTPLRHNRAVRDARGWFRWAPNVEAIFDRAGLEIDRVRKLVLACPPRYLGSAEDQAAVLQQKRNRR